MTSKDDLGDRMKLYEGIETQRTLDYSKPIYARIDGRSFSRFTRGMNRPFDLRMTAAMQETTKHLVEKTGAVIGYTQSDEISLVWYTDTVNNPESQPWFGAKIQKTCSVLASLATVAFNKEVYKWQDHYTDRLPHFDARVFTLLDKIEATNALLWRELDATRNAVQMAAYSKFGSKKLHGVNVKDMLKMLKEADVVFEDYPESFRRGSYFSRVLKLRTLTEAELESIPIKYRPSKEELLTRSSIELKQIPPLLKVANLVDVIFDNAEPVLKD